MAREIPQGKILTDRELLLHIVERVSQVEEGLTVALNALRHLCEMRGLSEDVTAIDQALQKPSNGVDRDEPTDPGV